MRAASFNRQLAKLAATVTRTQAGVEVDHADFREFEMPIYDGDLEEEKGLPAGAKKLIDRLTAADAVVISTPEYNGSIPGTLKNAIDWVSRAEDDVLGGKPILLLGASPGALGAVRGLWHTRVPFEALGAYVYPEMMGVGRANQAFDESGSLKEARQQQNLERLVAEFVQYAKSVTAKESKL